MIDNMNDAVLIVAVLLTVVAVFAVFVLDVLREFWKDWF